MYNKNYASHITQPGDTLHKLAIDYQTTVHSIMALNPDLNPYHLQTGSSINICNESKHLKASAAAPNVPAPNVPAPNVPAPDTPPSAALHIALFRQISEVFGQQIYWTRMLLTSIAGKLKNQAAITRRLSQIPLDAAKTFAPYYPPEATQAIARLLQEHLRIGAVLITALREGKNAEAEILQRQWYANAAHIADIFSGMNTYFEREETGHMLNQLLDLTLMQIEEHLAGNYPADIDAFNQLEIKTAEIADYFTTGLLKQFPLQFTE